MDLESLSKDELQKLRREVEKAITTHEDRRRQNAIAAVERVAAEHGFTLAQLVGAPAARGRGRRGVLPPKYINPADPSQTWSGRGRRPDWVKAALAEGKSLSDLAI